MLTTLQTIVPCYYSAAQPPLWVHLRAATLQGTFAECSVTACAATDSMIKRTDIVWVKVQRPRRSWGLNEKNGTSESVLRHLVSYLSKVPLVGSFVESLMPPAEKETVETSHPMAATNIDEIMRLRRESES